MTPPRVRVVKELGLWTCTQSSAHDWYEGAHDDEVYDTWREAYDRALEWSSLK